MRQVPILGGYANVDTLAVADVFQALSWNRLDGYGDVDFVPCAGFWEVTVRLLLVGAVGVTKTGVRLLTPDTTFLNVDNTANGAGKLHTFSGSWIVHVDQGNTRLPLTWTQDAAGGQVTGNQNSRLTMKWLGA